MNIRDKLCSLPTGGRERGVATLKQFSSLVADIYDAALDPTRWDQTLRHVCSAAGGSTSGLVVYDPKQRRRPHIMSATFSNPLQNRRYDEYFGRIDPLAPILERNPCGVIVTARSVTQENERRSEFYNDWARPNETADAVFVNVVANDNGLYTFVIGRGWRSKPFPTPELLRLVGLLVPHLERALHTQMRFGDLSLVRASALDLIDRWRHGCVLISATGAVLYVNRAANEIAASHDGLSIRARGLRAEIPREDATLQLLIHRAQTDSGKAPRSGSRVAISRSSARQPYTVQVLPVRMNRVYAGNKAAAALILIIDHGCEAQLEAADLRDAYNLTPAEARVALLVLKGHGLQFVADKLRVGLSTVRVHLQRVFEKTQTHRQVELAKLLVELEATLTFRT
jgi:DNA-binding CsgD family transcriptional regulator